MSFSQEVKMEILESKWVRRQYQMALASGFFRYSSVYNAQEISLRTGQEDISRQFIRLVRNLLGKDTTVRQSTQNLRNNTIHRVWIPYAADRKQLIEILDSVKLDETGEQVTAFLAGAYLACGNITDPEKGYHIEFVAKEKTCIELLSHTLLPLFPGFRTTIRRNHYVLYCKECAQIEDLLAMVGASKACLTMIDIEMIKGVRNQVNRVTNCETANIGKQVGAATTQVMDIQYIFDNGAEDMLTPVLLEAASLRLENPDASLRELCEITGGSVSRSGLHHRFAAIHQIANELRQKQKEG